LCMRTAFISGQRRINILFNPTEIASVKPSYPIIPIPHKTIRNNLLNWFSCKITSVTAILKCHQASSAWERLYLWPCNDRYLDYMHEVFEFIVDMISPTKARLLFKMASLTMKEISQTSV
jgi:hypothetical protein